MVLKDPPTIKEVIKIFVVGLALRSYAADSSGDGRQRRTSIGYELTRRLHSAAQPKVEAPTRYSNKGSTNRRMLWHMTPERLKDYDIRNKKRAAEQQRELNQSVQEFVSKTQSNIKQ